MAVPLELEHFPKPVLHRLGDSTYGMPKEDEFRKDLAEEDFEVVGFDLDPKGLWCLAVCWVVGA